MPQKITNILAFCLLLLLAFPAGLHAQDLKSAVTIKGQILNKSDSTPVQFMYIINLRSKMGTVTGSDGRFTITGSLNDSMRFSSVGYKDRYLTIDENMVKNGLTFYIGKTTYELEPVIIRPYKVTPWNTPKSLVIDKPTPRPPLRNLGATKPSRHGAFTIGWDPVLNNLRRQNAEIEKWNARDYLQSLVSQRYNKDFVGRLTGLSDSEAEIFMTYCDIPNDFVLSTTDYDLAVVVKQYYASYLRYHKTNNEFRP